jgi:broad specificity phosphatase PhoE
VLEIKLVRHGQSQANTHEVETRDVGDHNVALTETGREQARRAGTAIGKDFVRGSLVYTSPYRRTRETLEGILEGSGIASSELPRIYEDPRLREVEHGYDDVAGQEPLRRIHGWFYYRFRGGESPADCFDRTSGFLESLMRQLDRKDATRVLIVSHGLTIRCFVMRFLHLTVEQFESLGNPHNGDVITIASTENVDGPNYTCGPWAVTGLRQRAEGE